MKLICIGDIHASGFGDDPLVDNLPARLSYIKKTLDYIMAYGHEHNISNYVVLGDVYHDKTIIYNDSQAMLLDFFNRNKNSSFTIISGNHDLSSTGENQNSAIMAFEGLENVMCVYGEPYYQEATCALYVPFTNNFVEVLTNAKTKYANVRTKILFAHLGLNEAVLQSGLSRVDKVKISDLCSFRLAILGHYHKPQDLGNNITKVWYAGSLIPRDWNDKNESKRFLVLDTDTLEVESVPLDPVGIPRYIEYVIPPGTGEAEIRRVLQEASEMRSRGNKVRVINKNNIKIKNDVATDVVVVEQQTVDVTNRGITVDQTKLQQCEKYLDIKQIPEEEREDYLKVLKDNRLLDILEE